MSIIEDIQKLEALMPGAKLQKLEEGALLHQKNSNITFKVAKANAAELIIRAVQEKHLSENYADRKILVSRAKELFKPFAGARVLHVHPVPYKTHDKT